VLAVAVVNGSEPAGAYGVSGLGRGQERVTVSASASR
jgi:hypothetical protein